MSDTSKSPHEVITPQHAATVEGAHGLGAGTIWGIFQKILSNPNLIPFIQQLISMISAGKTPAVVEAPK